ncbi:prohibitin family protein [Luteibaculum oceani]|uniref:Prohibitin family protein n=1 Tax=Luteibaculum oceani TaxID=1294296 RepID=A0A5C6V231_9FLAO|nr:prohibitin family protein [Luteibaculum oceani]TXC77095.1 prohibitin family protein [Luteibaculum oceani]
MEDYRPEGQIQIKNFKLIATIVGALILTIIFWNRITVTIESGHKGVLYERFSGGVSETAQPYGPGFHFIAPWNDMIVYETRQQEMKEKMEVLSSNLLKIELDVTVLYEPVSDDLGLLEVRRGKNYPEKVVRPFTRSVVRQVMAQYLPEEINTTKRELIEDQIFEEVKAKMAENYVQVNDILIRNIVLPPSLQAAIERKLKQEQESLEYEFRIQKAQKEAERKKIEADGIRAFQEIVNKSITKDLLKWKGIEATENLAKSTNSKIIVIGNGDQGLPVILNAEK